MTTSDENFLRKEFERQEKRFLENLAEFYGLDPVEAEVFESMIRLDEYFEIHGLFQTAPARRIAEEITSWRPGARS